MKQNYFAKATLRTPSVQAGMAALLLSAVALTGCGPQRKTDTGAFKGKAPVSSIRDRIRDLALQNERARNEDPIDQKYTTENSIKGEWVIAEFNTSRTDDSARFFAGLLKTSNKLSLSLGDNINSGAKVTLKVTSPDGKCQVKIPLDGSYCCNTMLRFTFSESSLNPEESFPSCSQPAFKVHVNDLRDKANKFFTDSPTKNPMPSIFHFNHSKSGKRLRLQSPPPKDRNTKAEGVETEMILELSSLKLPLIRSEVAG